MAKQLIKINQSIIVYDDRLISQPDENIFKSEFWQPDSPVRSIIKGRGLVFFITIQNQSCVLRHYYRGGFIARFIKDQYIWLGQDSSRSFREWGLLQEMTDLDLPVPIPVAARVVRKGMLYQADILTKEIFNVESMGDKLSGDGMTDGLWSNIGKCILRFHHHGFFHMDLNVENIQINPSNKVYLLDFDQGRFSEPSRQLSNANLARLKRSVAKLMRVKQKPFPQSGWEKLMINFSQD